MNNKKPSLVCGSNSDRRKSESDFVRSQSDLAKSDSDLVKSESDLVWLGVTQRSPPVGWYSGFG